MSESVPSTKPPLEGFRGWLLALVILQFLFAFLLGFSVLVSVIRLINGVPGVPVNALRPAVIWLIVLHGTELGITCYAIFLLSQRRTRFVKVFGLQLVIFALMPLAQLLPMLTVAEALGSELNVLGSTIRAFFHGLFGLGLWFYVQRSVRVRNTLVR